MLRVIVIGVFILLGFFTCQLNQETESEGEQLAKQYCGSCHLLPTPDQLDMPRWKNDVLPKMGGFLGLKTGNYTNDLLNEGIVFPEEPLLSWSQWRTLTAHYIDQAPLIYVSKEAYLPVKDLSNQFEIVEPSATRIPPFTTMVAYDSTSASTFLGNGGNGQLMQINHLGQVIDQVELGRSPSGLWVSKEGMFSIGMGKVLPHDEKLGAFYFTPRNDQGKWDAKAEMLIDSLARPSYLSMEDIDGDGTLDAVISCFGNYIGELAVYFDVQQEQRKKVLLNSRPGAVKTAIVDFDQDGRLDILALMAQGDEGIFLYTMQNDKTFKEIPLLQFPPTYGSTYFELVDFNRDGLLDILYACGDNGDYQPLLKDYHGISVFMNNGDNTFSKSFFLPHHGAYKAKPIDFDQDGDLDIAAISYFPDYQNRPQEGFIYYENLGDNTFNAFSFEQSVAGKWLTLDAGDIDGDGDQDIILGSALFMTSEVPTTIKKDWQKTAPPYLILKNKLK